MEMWVRMTEVGSQPLNSSIYEAHCGIIRIIKYADCKRHTEYRNLSNSKG